MIHIQYVNIWNLTLVLPVAIISVIYSWDQTLVLGNSKHKILDPKTRHKDFIYTKLVVLRLSQA